MNNTVLLSTSLHPVSRQFSCNHKELAAWQLAQQVDKNPTADACRHNRCNETIFRLWNNRY